MSLHTTEEFPEQFSRTSVIRFEPITCHWTISHQQRCRRYAKRRHLLRRRRGRLYKLFAFDRNAADQSQGSMLECHSRTFNMADPLINFVSANSALFDNKDKNSKDNKFNDILRWRIAQDLCCDINFQHCCLHCSGLIGSFKLLLCFLKCSVSPANNSLKCPTDILK